VSRRQNGTRYARTGRLPSPAASPPRHCACHPRKRGPPRQAHCLSPLKALRRAILRLLRALWPGQGRIYAVRFRGPARGSGTAHAQWQARGQRSSLALQGNGPALPVAHLGGTAGPQNWGRRRRRERMGGGFSQAPKVLYGSKGI
jgi:hypothetical protein